MKRRSPRVKIFALQGTPVLAAAALAGALALSGCQVMSPIQTNVPYQPADGVAVDLGDVQIRDLVVIAGAKGEVGTLSGLVVNKGTESVTVTFAAGTGGSSAQADIPAGTATRLSGVEGATPVTLPGIAAAPGGIVKVTVSTPAAGAPEVSVPVLLPTGYYSTITPPPVPTTTTAARPDDHHPDDHPVKATTAPVKTATPLPRPPPAETGCSRQTNGLSESRTCSPDRAR